MDTAVWTASFKYNEEFSFHRVMGLTVRSSSVKMIRDAERELKLTDKLRETRRINHHSHNTEVTDNGTVRNAIKNCLIAERLH